MCQEMLQDSRSNANAVPMLCSIHAQFAVVLKLGGLQTLPVLLRLRSSMEFVAISKLSEA